MPTLRSGWTTLLDLALLCRRSRRGRRHVGQQRPVHVEHDLSCKAMRKSQELARCLDMYSQRLVGICARRCHV